MNRRALALIAEPLGLAEDGRSRSSLIHAINCLTERQQQVMSMTHEHSMTWREIGAVLKISANKAAEIYAQSIVELQRLLARH